MPMISTMSPELRNHTATSAPVPGEVPAAPLNLLAEIAVSETLSATQDSSGVIELAGAAATAILTQEDMQEHTEAQQAASAEAAAQNVLAEMPDADLNELMRYLNRVANNRFPARHDSILSPEDLVQDTFERLARSATAAKIWREQGLDNLKRYAAQVVKARAIDLNRRHNRLSIEPTDSEQPVFTREPSACNTEAVALDTVSLNELSRLLSKTGIAPQHIEALLLFEVTGMSYEEIAQHKRVSIGTVRSRIARARKQLADSENFKAYAASTGHTTAPRTPYRHSSGRRKAL